MKTDYTRIARELRLVLAVIRQPCVTEEARADALYHVSVARLLLIDPHANIISGGEHSAQTCIAVAVAR